MRAFTAGEYTVSLDMQGHGRQVSDQLAPLGGKITKPTTPADSSWIFDGWYKEADCTNKRDFSTYTVSEEYKRYG